MGDRNDSLRRYVFCTRHALLRPIARILRYLEPFAVTRERVAHLCKICTQDPGLPRNNPTQSFWQQPPHPTLASIQSPELPKQSDVLIIGSGITAASTAYHLLANDPNITVTIAEARTLTSGATGRNGGHILELPYEDYSTQLAITGKKDTEELIRFRLDHLGEMLRFAKTSMSSEAMKESEIRLVEVVHAIFDDRHWREMKAELSRFVEDFPDQADKWRIWEGREAREKFGIQFACGAITGPSGALWPYKFVTSIYADLLDKFSRRIHIETSTAVQKVEVADAASAYAYTCYTPRGQISSKHIVHATNGHAGHLLPRMRGKIFPLRGQLTVQSHSSVAVNAKPSTAGSRAWLLSYARGYDYMTQSPRSGNYFLGGGTLQGDDAGMNDIGNASDERENFLALSHLTGVLGRVFERSSTEAPDPSLVSSWTGVMGFSCDWRPWVGRLPTAITERRPVGKNMDGCSEWIAAGYCGSGMVYCWRSGQAIASMILGNGNSGLPACLAPTMERFHRSTTEDAATQWVSMSL